MGIKVIVVQGTDPPQVGEIERLTPTGLVRWVEGTEPKGLRWRAYIKVPSNAVFPYSDEALARLTLRQERYKAAAEVLTEARADHAEAVRMADNACGQEPLKLADAKAQLPS